MNHLSLTNGFGCMVVLCLSIHQIQGWSLNPFSLLGGVSEIISTDPKCFNNSDLGCFKRFPASKALNLPSMIGYYPSDPKDIEVSLNMFVCTNPYRPYVIMWNDTEQKIKKSPFNPSLRTIFIVHGFRDSYDEMNWMGDMKDFILNDYQSEGRVCKNNVIGVDWRKGSQIANYLQATSNTQVVGASIARIIRLLIKHFNVTEDDFAIVGHSLGSHVSGFAGKRFKENKLRTIIGLDPAGPCFTDVDDEFRLSTSDAKLVLSIHTNGGMHVGDNFGISVPLGHYSFFPNGGSQQPGCEKTTAITRILLEGFKEGLTDTVACSHRRATRLVQFDDKLLTNAQSIAYACDSYEDYRSGKCGQCETEEDCKRFGGWFDYWLDQLPSPNWTKPKSYYTDTTNMIPWTFFSFQFVVRTGSDFKPFNGTILMEAIGEMRDGNAFGITPANNLIEPSKSYSFLLNVPKDLGKVIKVYLKLSKHPIEGVVLFDETPEENEINNNEDEQDASIEVVIEEVNVRFLSNSNKDYRSAKSSRLISTNKKIYLGNNTIFEEEI